ncbi:MAG TPA: RNA polymerase sigma factor [Hungateiclostridium thermocellum]|jgi:RNA polymerase sigma-70 factor (ECF subfamily)|nr:RNA polymerase sigma factor [Acetivibrio thermocellus]CDG37019.1 RNA polymerase, sigma-24 subunit, ECF subfamily [Acetivibrio thermocellus BC1]ADU73224.1 RNA polymerase, sigma-24 subunit, ECF subfamily [Acetivibrio thermocellus DSM 1313]ALX07139.1 RNA polymerase, sigma-24 subunit, RpoE, ECF subfamily [Acetivibrio thermocellus AD2]ANV74875.1 RNA polymerase, sigma-24 subunit, RpoE, ECF subfamily [Acetivibrio thermocellus DSM 2360]EIC03941.1 RNA polymerase sigma factor, sigma-70 family [Acetiv
MIGVLTMNKERDNILIESTLKGNINSFEELMTLYQGKLFNFLLKMTSSREDAEEITQEVFIKVYNNLYKYNNRWSFSTWIYRIAINTLRSEYRKAKNVKSVDYYTNVSELPANFSDYPELAYEMKERQKEIIKLIDELKEDQKTALLLRYMQDFSFKEIGDILGISPEAAKMKIQRAKQSICKKYEELEKDGG